MHGCQEFSVSSSPAHPRFRPTSLIRRLIQPSEVADLILFTSSDRASATTGAALKVEGGTLTSLTP
ncbi:SDR family oxidoreductase [Streptomyces sp. NPDC058964]|uniref:SDR family oxidoreductase n=1 Tax=Streptomyces sp. NPDC058964 TaxID=3346681 RepID=UPI00369DFD27